MTAELPPGAATAKTAHGGHMARSVVSVTIARGLSILLGLAREVLASAFYGTSAAFSAFSIAFEMPNLLLILIGQGGLTAALLPALVEHEEKGDYKAIIALVSRIVMLVTLSLTLVAIVFVLVAPTLVPAILGSGFSAATTDLTVKLSQLLFPIVVLLGAQSVAVAVLNSQNRFSIPAFAPAVWNVVVITGLIFLRPVLTSDNGIHAYVVAVLAATIIQLAWLAPGLKPLRIKAAFRRASEQIQIRRLFIRMAPVAVVAVAWQGDTMTNVLVGSLVGGEVPRAIQAAQRLSVVGYALVSVAISTVAFPTFRRMVIRKQAEPLANLIGRTVVANLTLLLPIAALVVVVASPITAIVYQRGEFNAHSTDLVSTTLTWLIIGVPAVGLWELLTKVCFASDRYWQPAGIAAFNLALNLALSLWWQATMGIKGIALATSVSFTLASIGLAAYVRLAVARFNVRSIMRSAVVLALVATVAAIAAAGCRDLIQSEASTSFGPELAEVVIAAVVGGGVYLLGLRVAAPKEFAALITQLGRAAPWRHRTQ